MGEITHDVAVEIVAGLLLLVVLSVVAAIGFCLKMRAQVAEAQSRILHIEKDVERVVLKLDQVERDGRKGRQGIYNRIEARENETAHAMSEFRQDMSSRLEHITEIMADFKVVQTELKTRFEISDRRNDKNNG